MARRGGRKRYPQPTKVRDKTMIKAALLRLADARHHLLHRGRHDLSRTRSSIPLSLKIMPFERGIDFAWIM